MKCNTFTVVLSFVFISFSSVFLAGCLPGSNSPPTSEGEVTQEQPSVEAQVINITAKDFQFSVPEIRVKQNQVVKVVITNDGGFHDFVIEELGVKTGIIPVGQSREVLVPTQNAGEFTFYCSVSNHRSRGMEGKVIIEKVE